MIGKTISHYKLLDELGRGGMGVVYRAEDTVLKRIVAIKILRPLSLSANEDNFRFLREARSAAALNHPNICTIYETGKYETRPFIVMEYVEGISLKEWITSRSHPNVRDSLAYALQIAAGLQAAHKKGIIHRDMKCDNVMVNDLGIAKIMDFGLAKQQGCTQVTKEGTALGTVAYMSPEQACGKQIDQRTDIWSFGVMLYEMVTGQLPFPGEYEHAVLYSILNEEPELPTALQPEVPVELEQIILKAITKAPEKRYQRMDEVMADLKLVSEAFTPRPGKRRKWQTRKALPEKKKALRYFLIALFTVVTGGAGYYFFSTAKQERTIESIAVLPLENLSGDPEQEYFADGMTDALIGELARISALRVISRTSVMQYKGARVPLVEIAKKLNVDAVVEGTVQRDGRRVRITAQLIGMAPERHLLAESYERDLDNILILQKEVARAIAQKINIKLTPLEESLLTAAREVNPALYEAYLKGMFYLNQFTPGGIKKGLVYLQQAVKEGPADPLAYAGLAIGYNLLAHTPSPPPSALPQARMAALKALELDENLAEVHLALAMIKIYGDWDREGAGRDYRRALELSPNLAMAHAHYGWYLEMSGQVDEALEELDRAQKLDPLLPIYPAWSGWLNFWEGRYDTAIEEAKKSLELNPDFPIGLYVLGGSYAAKGKYGEAIALQRKAGALNPDFEWALGQTYALAGRKKEALNVATKLKGKARVWDTFGLAEIYTALGEKDEAFRWLEAAYEQRHPYIQWFMRNGSFDPLKGDPRYTDLARRLNLAELDQ